MTITKHITQKIMIVSLALLSACPLLALNRLETKLFEAVEKNDLHALKRVLSEAKEPRTRFNINVERDGETALMLAAYNANRDIVDYLIEAKADINKTNEWGLNALAFAQGGKHTGTGAAKMNQERVVNALKAAGATYTGKSMDQVKKEMLQQIDATLKKDDAMFARLEQLDAENKRLSGATAAAAVFRQPLDIEEIKSKSRRGETLSLEEIEALSRHGEESSRLLDELLRAPIKR